MSSTFTERNEMLTDAIGADYKLEFVIPHITSRTDAVAIIHCRFLQFAFERDLEAQKDHVKICGETQKIDTSDKYRKALLNHFKKSRDGNVFFCPISVYAVVWSGRFREDEG